MSERKTIEGTIAADWWMLAGALRALLYRDRRNDPNAPSYSSVPLDGYRFTIGGLATVQLSTGAAPTTVRIEYPRQPGADDYFNGLYRYLAVFADSADSIRREVQPTADNVIQRYYRARAAGGKVTLKMLAEESGYSYEYLLKAKQRYDRAGKWGSKKGSSRHPTIEGE